MIGAFSQAIKSSIADRIASDVIDLIARMSNGRWGWIAETDVISMISKNKGCCTLRSSHGIG
ncbi:MAG: hypothetical protein Q4A75_01690 [Peptostreptococcaceae bacterium]|nr:hypothetical protein [Peptostreptococcaceae bacterium]